MGSNALVGEGAGSRGARTVEDTADDTAVGDEGEQVLGGAIGTADAGEASLEDAAVEVPRDHAVQEAAPEGWSRCKCTGARGFSAGGRGSSGPGRKENLTKAVGYECVSAAVPVGSMMAAKVVRTGLPGVAPAEALEDLEGGGAVAGLEDLRELPQQLELESALLVHFQIFCDEGVPSVGWRQVSMLLRPSQR
ncbi:MAG: hypothetical protein IPP07_09615 [Holophagales bacterium]|nr:hypothetical protein [Holophagales bacterium]MBK9965125.1 hypothetical protein [Holophagales bacterium]